MNYNVSKGEIVSVNISREKGDIKHPVEEIEIDQLGIIGDSHSGNWHRQISLLSIESIEEFNKKFEQKFSPGAFAENITTRGIRLSDVAILDKLRIGDVELEITQIGKECHTDGCAIYRQVGKCIMPTDGVFARVIDGGKIRPGDEIELCPRPFDIRIVTISDRASAGAYEDKSGPIIEQMLADFFAQKPWHIRTKRMIIPDDSDKLARLLEQFSEHKIDIIITTGGTGIGPRDFTPQVVNNACDKIIPGIMDYIRIKYGAENPNALISRSVAGVMNESLIFAIPGSSKAVREYISEILKLLEHLVLMLHGINHH
ncbi:molybdenum cofactor synthesis protein [bacterium]|nr:MAG: molybdenum cofactor synthesis protein [bacterium]